MVRVSVWPFQMAARIRLLISNLGVSGGGLTSDRMSGIEGEAWTCFTEAGA